MMASTSPAHGGGCAGWYLPSRQHHRVPARCSCFFTAVVQHIHTFYSPRTPSHHRALLTSLLAHGVSPYPWAAFKVLPVPQPSSLPLHSSTHLVAHFLVAFNNVNKHQHLAPCVALSCPAFWHPSLRSKRRHSPTATQRSVSALFQPTPLPPSRPTLTLLRAMPHQTRTPLHVLLRRLHQGPGSCQLGAHRHRLDQFHRGWS